jgi:hypothetical protein
MPIDDRNVISKDTARKIRNLVKSEHTPLGAMFIKFLQKEEHCAPDIIRTIERCTRVIISNTILNRQDDSILPPPMDGLFDPGPEFPPPVDEIRQAFDITSTYTQVQIILQNIFAAGMAYGRAIHETWMDELDDIPEQAMSIKEITKMQVKDEIIEIAKLFSSMLKQADLTAEEIREIEENVTVEEEYEIEGGPAGEEDLEEGPGGPGIQEDS